MRRWEGLGAFWRGENHTGETGSRILARSVSWRIGGVVTAVVVTVLLTGNLTLGIEVGVAYNLIRFFSHLVHDYIWTRYIRWGTRLPQCLPTGKPIAIIDGDVRVADR